MAKLYVFYTNELFSEYNLDRLDLEQEQSYFDLDDIASPTSAMNKQKFIFFRIIV